MSADIANHSSEIEHFLENTTDNYSIISLWQLLIEEKGLNMTWKSYLQALTKLLDDIKIYIDDTGIIKPAPSKKHRFNAKILQKYAGVGEAVHDDEESWYHQ